MIEEVASNIWRIGGGTWGLDDLNVLSAEGDCNVYLLKLKDASILVDAGTTAGQSAIEANLLECGVVPRKLSALLLTHSHFDHTECAHRWQASYAVPTYLNSVGAEFLARDDFRLVGYHICGPDYVFEPFDVHYRCEDGHIHEISGVVTTTFHMPGHTPDSTLFLIENGQQRIGICGDITFSPRPGSIGEIGWLSLLWLSDLSRYQGSLRRLLDMKIDVLLPGHGHVLVGEDPIREALALSLSTVERLRANPDTRHFGIVI